MSDEYSLPYTDFAELILSKCVAAHQHNAGTDTAGATPVQNLAGRLALRLTNALQQSLELVQLVGD